jgi:succinate dehydrogenase/fumarate reductase flavoprotein subunit
MSTSGLEQLDQLELSADVVVVGGGPAGAWAALAAKRDGADVLLVDKGYCGTSGAAAAAGVGTLYVPPKSEAREKAIKAREFLGGNLAERDWMERILDEIWHRLPELADFGFPFADEYRPTGDPDNPGGTIGPNGGSLGLQGPDLMRTMRKTIKRAGVRILDQSPVLELLVDDDGVVGGVRGIRRQLGQHYRVSAGAVILATGGCAFLSNALGTNVDTGDGLLYAVEAGADLSGMEFSAAYSPTPMGGTTTKGFQYVFGTFYREDGSLIEGAGMAKGRSTVIRELTKGRVFCEFNKADDRVARELRISQPNMWTALDKMEINPVKQRFEITLLLEGTVRGTGGIRLVSEDCASTVPGLYAAGDAATRELLCGGFTGGGSHNVAWATASGNWAGRGATAFARALGSQRHNRVLHGVGGAGLHPTGTPGPADDYREVIRTVQDEVMPYEKNYFRTEKQLRSSLRILHDTWKGVRSSLYAEGAEQAKVRSAAAMTATSRWMYESALARPESRGMHRRDDIPYIDPGLQSRLLSGGLDEVWTRYENPAAAPTLGELTEVAA